MLVFTTMNYSFAFVDVTNYTTRNNQSAGDTLYLGDGKMTSTTYSIGFVGTLKGRLVGYQTNHIMMNAGLSVGNANWEYTDKKTNHDSECYVSYSGHAGSRFLASGSYVENYGKYGDNIQRIQRLRIVN